MAVDVKHAQAMIRDSAALGLQMFHLDAGWFAASAIGAENVLRQGSVLPTASPAAETVGSSDSSQNLVLAW